MPEKFNPKTLVWALSVVAIALVFGTVFVFAVIMPLTVVHNHHSEQSLIEKYWPVRKQ